jgi:hypothetical protein
MQKIFIALVVAVLAVGPAAVSEKTDVMVPVHQFVDGFNKDGIRSERGKTRNWRRGKPRATHNFPGQLRRNRVTDLDL